MIVPGDKVTLLQQFDDGWALGFNETTQKQGAFPFACLGNR